MGGSDGGESGVDCPDSMRTGFCGTISEALPSDRWPGTTVKPGIKVLDDNLVVDFLIGQNTAIENHLVDKPATTKRLDGNWRVEVGRLRMNKFPFDVIFEGLLIENDQDVLPTGGNGEGPHEISCEPRLAIRERKESGI